MTDFVLDEDRIRRTGAPEAILAAGKSADQVRRIAEHVLAREGSIFVTRLSPKKAAALAGLGEALRYHPLSRTAVISALPVPEPRRSGVTVVAAGTSDMGVAEEARQTLHYLGVSAGLVADVGVAGLWRLMDRIEEIRAAQILIAVAGMEGALFSVLGGLVSAPVIAVPTSVGYGVSKGGRAALRSALATCAPGVLAMNIDNGFGAAVSAARILGVTAGGAPENGMARGG